MEERYGAAVAISQLQAGGMKDGFWRDWKKSIHTALDAIVAEVSSRLPGGLSASTSFPFGRVGATLVIKSSGPPTSKWVPSSAAPYPNTNLPPLPRSVPFVWDTRIMSPDNAQLLLQLIADRQILDNPPALQRMEIENTHTTMLLCKLPLFAMLTTNFNTSFPFLTHLPMTQLVSFMPYSRTYV